MSETIRIFLADDHPLVREGMRALIMTEPEMELLGMAEDGDAALKGALRTRPDVLLLDLSMPHKSGVEVIGAVRSQLPDIRILVVTSFSDDAHVFAAMKAGAHGYLLKDASPTELLRAIRTVHAGETLLHPMVAEMLIKELKKPARQPLTTDPLTPREVEILQLIAKGFSNQDMADRLVVSERTVRTHVSNILDKLHLANRTQAALFALREGLARLDDE